MKKYFLIICLLCPILIFGQDNNKITQNDDVIINFMRLSSQQLFDTANYYTKKNSYDSALVCYNLLINSISKNADIEQQNILQNAYNRSAQIYISLSDYRIAYDFLVKRLFIIDKYDFVTAKVATYANIGLIYTYLKQYETAQQYLQKSLDLCSDSSVIVLLLNNLGNNELLNNKTESGFKYLNKSIQISKRHNNVHIHYMLNNFASYYQLIKQYDSAFHYYRLSLEQSRINKSIEVEATNLSEIGKLYFELNKIDSALYYIELSNKIASENKFIRTLADNYLTLSEMEKSKGRFENALNHHITYTNLKDSVYNSEVFGSINLIQRQYDVSKTNQQIEELVIEKQIKENTIRYQKIILFIVFGVLLLVVFVLLIIIYQKRNLNKAYKVLFEKNVEIVELQDNKSENNVKKNTKTRPENKHSELLNKILIVMEDPSIYCNTEFSIEKLAEMTHSNQKYVSEAINNILNKNFRSFLNSYRIREAQKLFSNPNIAKYTIESVAPLVGFKSPKTFREAFSEITGVSPSYYLKSIQNQQNN